MLSVSLIVMSSPMFCSIISLSLCHSLAFPINSFNAFLLYSLATTMIVIILTHFARYTYLVWFSITKLLTPKPIAKHAQTVFHNYSVLCIPTTSRLLYQQKVKWSQHRKQLVAKKRNILEMVFDSYAYQYQWRWPSQVGLGVCVCFR